MYEEDKSWFEYTIIESTIPLETDRYQLNHIVHVVRRWYDKKTSLETLLVLFLLFVLIRYSLIL
jgi:hypothetical protein